MELNVIAHMHSDFPEKFGIPRQSGLVNELKSRIVFEKPYNTPDAFRGLEGYSHIWIIWGFSENTGKAWSPTVRPPRLGGNVRQGVFATRSPFRPNPLGLSCVRLDRIEYCETKGPVLHVSGADLMNGTPIYDIKPYLTLADCHPDAACGFAKKAAGHCLRVELPEELAEVFDEEQKKALIGVLAQDPRPSYQHEPERIYGMGFAGYNVRFRVEEDLLSVCDIQRI